MKQIRTRTLLAVVIVVSSLGYIMSCTHKDSVAPAAANNNVVVKRDSAILLPGTMTTGDSTQWKLDKVHSNCMWSTNYVGAAGLLTGRFNYFGIHDISGSKIGYLPNPGTAQPYKDSSWAFYESDPTKTYFNGYVQINSSNTGEAGRDTGCNISTLGTIKIINGTANLSDSNLAKINTTKVEYDPLSSDYIVTMNLTWRGKLAAPITKSIVGRLQYVKVQRVQFGTAAAYKVFGLKLMFSFNCRDFGIVSTSIGDNVDIEVNMNFNNK